MIVLNTKSIKALNQKLRNIAREYLKAKEKPKEIHDFLFDKGNSMRNHIITEMRNTERAPWSYKKTKDGKRHHPSMPGKFPAIDEGEGVRSLAFDITTSGNIKMEFGANAGAPYMEHLEKGTNRMAARPWMEPTIDKFEDEIINGLGDIVPDNAIKFMIDGTR